MGPEMAEEGLMKELGIQQEAWALAVGNKQIDLPIRRF